MPFLTTNGAGRFSFPSKEEIHAAGQWMDRSSDLYKSAMNGKPITSAERRALQMLQRKMGTVFSPSSLLGNMMDYGVTHHPYGMAAHRALRDTAEKSVIDALIISARLHQVAHVARRIIIEGKQKGWKVVHYRHIDPDFQPDPSVRDRCVAVEQFLENPRADVHPGGFRDLLMRAAESELILDRKCLIIERDRRFRPLRFHLLPPDDILPRMAVLNPIMAQLNVTGSEGEERATQFVYQLWQVDVSEAAYIQVLDGQVTGAWRAEEISVDICLPTSRLDAWYYGNSPLQRSMGMSTMLIYAFNYNEKMFTAAWPEAFLNLKGAVSEEDLAAFKQQIYAEVGAQGNQRLPVIAMGDEENGAELLKLRDSLHEMEYTQLVRLCVALKCSAYRAHPSLLNMATDNGGASPIINNGTEEVQIALAQEEGLASLTSNIADWLTRALVQWIDPELRLVFSMQDQPTEVEQIQLWEKKTALGFTVDEFRASQGQPPLAEATMGLVSGTYVNSSFFFQQQQQQVMAMHAQTAMPDAPAAAGQEEAVAKSWYAEVSTGTPVQGWTPLTEEVVTLSEATSQCAHFQWQYVRARNVVTGQIIEERG